MSKASGQPNASIFIKNLPFSAKEADLKEIFDKFGRLRDVYIPLDFYTKKPRGFAYIQFEDIKDAETCISEMTCFEFKGREVDVKFAEGDRKDPAQMERKDHKRFNSGGMQRRGRGRGRGGGPYYPRDGSPPDQRFGRERYYSGRYRSLSPMRDRSPLEYDLPYRQRSSMNAHGRNRSPIDMNHRSRSPMGFREGPTYDESPPMNHRNSMHQRSPMMGHSPIMNRRSSGQRAGPSRSPPPMGRQQRSHEMFEDSPPPQRRRQPLMDMSPDDFRSKGKEIMGRQPLRGARRRQMSYSPQPPFRNRGRMINEEDHSPVPQRRSRNMVMRQSMSPPYATNEKYGRGSPPPQRGSRRNYSPVDNPRVTVSTMNKVVKSGSMHNRRGVRPRSDGAVMTRPTRKMPMNKQPRNQDYLEDISPPRKRPLKRSPIRRQEVGEDVEPPRVNKSRYPPEQAEEDSYLEDLSPDELEASPPPSRPKSNPVANKRALLPAPKPSEVPRRKSTPIRSRKRDEPQYSSSRRKQSDSRRNNEEEYEFVDEEEYEELDAMDDLDIVLSDGN